MRQRMLKVFSHWGPWMVIAYFGIVAVIVALFTLNSQTIKRDAAQEATVARCISSRPTLLRFQTHVRGVGELAQVLVHNSRYRLRNLPDGDPEKKIARANLHRLARAERKVAALPTVHVPTRAECEEGGNG